VRRNRKIAQLNEAIVNNILDGVNFRSEIRNNISEEDIIEEFRKQFEQLVNLGILTEDEYDLLEDKLVDKVRIEKEKLEEKLKSVETVISEKPEEDIKQEQDFGGEEGEVVMPNASLFRISQLDKVRLMIYVSEEELARVKLGQPADVYIDAFPKKPFSGKIIYISSIAEFTPKNVQTKEDRTKLVFGVKIEIPNQEHILKPGMPADAVIKINNK
jgi:multidrug efflux pump subunit AcrA (membrane-fusion protein)